MAERLDLTALYHPDPRTAADLSVSKIILDWDGQGLIIVVGKGDVRREFAYNGAQAVTLMTAINKANLTVKSLQRRILEQLVSDGKLVGTISGAPD